MFNNYYTEVIISKKCDFNIFIMSNTAIVMSVCEENIMSQQQLYTRQRINRLYGGSEIFKMDRVGLNNCMFNSNKDLI